MIQKRPCSLALSVTLKIGSFEGQINMQFSQISVSQNLTNYTSK